MQTDLGALGNTKLGKAYENVTKKIARSFIFCVKFNQFNLFVL